MSDVTVEQQAVRGHKKIVERLWTEPILEACAQLLGNPAGVNVLVAEARCGLVPTRWIETLPATTRVIALDGSSAMLDAARERMGDGLQRRIFFVQQRVNKLSYTEGAFPVAVCCNGIVTARQLQEGLGELQRVTSSGGQVLVAVPLASSFGAFYDLLDEALRANGQGSEVARILELRHKSLLRVGRMAEIARRLGLGSVEVRELSWTVGFRSGREFLESPLIQETFFPHWIGAIRSSERDTILRYLVHAIDTYWRDRMMHCTVTAGVLMALKP